jgi:hypothetical protein
MIYVGILLIRIMNCGEGLHDPHHRLPSFANYDIEGNENSTNSSQEQKYCTEYCKTKRRHVCDIYFEGAVETEAGGVLVVIVSVWNDKYSGEHREIPAPTVIGLNRLAA